MAAAPKAEAIGLFGPTESDPIEVSPIPAVNVASVPQRSPLRYPGGKTWLIPHIRVWLERIHPAPRLLIEPFAGGGIVSLTAVMEGLVDRCLMAFESASCSRRETCMESWKPTEEHHDKTNQITKRRYDECFS